MTGAQRRRFHEWETMRQRFAHSQSIRVAIDASDPEGCPTQFVVDYDLLSICGVGEDGAPEFHRGYKMLIILPPNYPCVDAPPCFRFVPPVPYHPNVRYRGDMAGHVCLNRLNTFVDLTWGVERIASYLRYELYHAEMTPPYPEDLDVARWVRETGEPKRLIYFNQRSNY